MRSAAAVERRQRKPCLPEFDLDRIHTLFMEQMTTTAQLATA